MLKTPESVALQLPPILLIKWDFTHFQRDRSPYVPCEFYLVGMFISFHIASHLPVHLHLQPHVFRQTVHKFDLTCYTSTQIRFFFFLKRIHKFDLTCYNFIYTHAIYVHKKLTLVNLRFLIHFS